MKYAIVRQDGVTELHEEIGSLPIGAIELNDEQYSQLASGSFVLQGGNIVTYSPPPPVQNVRAEILNVSQQALASGFLHILMYDLMQRYLTEAQAIVPSVTEADLLDVNGPYYSKPYADTRAYYLQLLALQDLK